MVQDVLQDIVTKSEPNVWHFFERPAKLARGGPAPWSTRMLNPGEETCSVLVYWINQSAYRNISHFHIQTSELKSLPRS